MNIWMGDYTLLSYSDPSLGWFYRHMHPSLLTAGGRLLQGDYLWHLKGCMWYDASACTVAQLHPLHVDCLRRFYYSLQMYRWTHVHCHLHVIVCHAYAVMYSSWIITSSLPQRVSHPVNTVTGFHPDIALVCFHCDCNVHCIDHKCCMRNQQ